MKSSVITFPGSNCDRDMDVALKKFGFKNKWFGTMILNYQKVI
jgi:phosphoribosylformylglycinamidine (FGAM) synthase-like amidotransferase family enzyme